MHPRPPTGAVDVTLSAPVGRLLVSVQGPPLEAAELLIYLQGFEPSALATAATASPSRPVSASVPVTQDPLLGSRPSSSSGYPSAGSREHRVASSNLTPSTPCRGEVQPATRPPLGFSPSPPSGSLSAPHSPVPAAAAPASSVSSPVPVTQDPLLARGPPLPRSRVEVESTFPVCPEELICLSGSNLSPRARIQRAWKAGCWAREKLSGRSVAVGPSAALSLPSRVYPVVGGGSTEVVLYRSFRAYKAALGPLEGSPSVSHGFPSEAEARTYCVAAGVGWPLPLER